MNEEFRFLYPYLFPPFDVLVCAECFNFIIVVMVESFFTPQKKVKAIVFLPPTPHIFFVASDNNFIQPAVPHFDSHYDIVARQWRTFFNPKSIGY